MLCPSQESCRLKVDATGLPWSPKGAAEGHLLEISGNAARLVSGATGQGIIVRLDDKVSFVVNPPRGVYEKQSLGKLNIADERAESRARALEKILASNEPEETIEKWLLREGLRRDGKTIITVEETEKVRLLAGRTCTLTKIVENGKDRVLLWMAPDLSRPPGFDRFLRETGLLPGEMVEKVVSLQGFPLGIEIKLDYKVADIRVSLFATSYEAVEIPPENFKVPEGLIPKDQAQDVAKDTCPTCGKKLEGNRMFPQSFPERGGYTLHYDSAACRMAGLKAYLDKQDKGGD